MAGLGGRVGLARLARAAAWLGARQRDRAGRRAGTGRRRAGAVPRVHDGQGQGCRERPVARGRPRPGGGGARGDGARRRGCASTPTGRGRSTTRSWRWAALPPTTSSTPSSRARRWRSCATCGWRWRATASMCPSRPTSPSARPRTRCACAASRLPTSSSSRSRRSVGCGPRCGRRGLRAAGRRVVGARHQRRHLGRGRARRCLPSLDHACGLGTVALLAGDVAATAARAGGRGAAGGSRGVEPDRLEQLAAPPERICLVARPRGRLCGTPAGGDPMIDVRWTWPFLDTPRADAGRSWAFWSEVTGWPLSADPRRRRRVRHAAAHRG